MIRQPRARAHRRELRHLDFNLVAGAILVRPRFDFRQTGANAGCVGALTVTSVDGRPDVAVMETVEDTVSETPGLVRKALGIFDRVRSEALPRGASLDVIMEAAKQWQQ